METDARLVGFLSAYLGEWGGGSGLTVVGSELRTRPGWDGTVLDVVGIAAPEGGVLSVVPERADGVRAAVAGWAEVPALLPGAVGRPDATVWSGVFRWTVEPADLDDAGEWVGATDPRLPDWLHPFGGQVLVAFHDGAYAAGVGIKRHNPQGLEISVGTDEQHRGRGLASRLVAQAARWILAQGAIPTYLHDPANAASDRTALRAGFPDRGWRIVGVSR
ncbi:GNAT superfamily N-acetyltransferase [Allocatelliglobosispora scoriae]|uniref:GNAT superfamily N-acetyltransferase n=1 Tax=Allocatelliglobosispora scoriae TaxID=643052 RepID=A0A841C0C2_9ACTN|nr:GNAT family N-acetyltransferase [Allocatelliglobosispora scoriae]MBB5872799.1 GNAT superfamily N-acetyltransferase [Allocatelliglobosispora scoriae]